MPVRARKTSSLSDGGIKVLGCVVATVRRRASCGTSADPEDRPPISGSWSPCIVMSGYRG
jgi:hypothetical protein